MALFWILIILALNGIISFAYVVATSGETTTLWALLSVNFLFYLGITQTGVVLSGIMRISKSEWGKYFSRFGEILTLSFIPVAFIVFIIIYIGGTERLFWWAKEGASHDAHGHMSPWLGKGLFLWRNILLMAGFYILSLVYFLAARREEYYEKVRMPVPVGLEKFLNVMAGVTIFMYVAANTNIAWDFGMMIIKHWESTIFPAYYWVGNIFAGAAFLFVIANRGITRRTGKTLDKGHLESMSVFLMGFTLLWIYMFWSQHIVMWYGDMPNLTVPFYKPMKGYFATAFIVMMFGLFVLPFLALLVRSLKMRLASVLTVSVIVCVGVWVSKYLMILPVFEDGSSPAFATWTNCALVAGGAAITILSVKAFQGLFPEVSVTTTEAGDNHDSNH